MLSTGQLMTPSLLLVLSAVLLGLGTVLAKGLLSSGALSLHPLTFLIAQLAGGLFVLFAFARITQQILWTGSLVRLLLPGLFIGVGSIGTILALYFTTATEASLVFATQPIMVLFLARMFLKEGITIAVAILAMVAVAGVISIVQVGGSEEVLNRGYGVGFAIFSTTCAAIYVTWMRHSTQMSSPVMALITVQSVAFVVAVSGWVVWQFPGHADIRFHSLGAAAATGAIHYGAAFLLYLYGLRDLEASKAGIYLSLVPVFTIVLALIILDEVLTIQQLVGGVVVILAVAGVAWLSAREQ